jgi:hypothetical protein
MLWTILVHPTRFSPHLQCHGQLVNFGKVVAPTLVAAGIVANHFVEICEIVQFNGKLIPKGISILNDVQSFLVQAIDIDVRGHTVALGFRVWEPRGDVASSARIVNATTTSAKWTGTRENNKEWLDY